VWFHRSDAHGIDCIVGGCPLMFRNPVDFGHHALVNDPGRQPIVHRVTGMPKADRDRGGLAKSPGLAKPVCRVTTAIARASEVSRAQALRAR
jgi:hypothetical protein